MDHSTMIEYLWSGGETTGDVRVAIQFIVEDLLERIEHLEEVIDENNQSKGGGVCICIK